MMVRSFWDKKYEIDTMASPFWDKKYEIDTMASPFWNKKYEIDTMARPFKMKIRNWYDGEPFLWDLLWHHSYPRWHNPPIQSVGWL